MPRPRKTTATTKKHLTKAEITNISSQEKKLKLGRGDLVTPAWLQDDLVAHNEFVRIVTEAGTIDLLDNLDLSILVMYCKAYSSYVECTKMISEHGYVGVGKDGIEKISPYVTAQIKYTETIFKCSSKLGLSTTDRLKLIVPKKDESETNKYLKYVK